MAVSKEYNTEPDLKEGSLKQWQQAWENDHLVWHLIHVNLSLKRNFHHLQNEEKSLKILIPLCGKSLDMKWLYELGHVIIGVEGSEKAIKDFFAENNIEFSELQISGLDGKLFKSRDNRIRLYCCDFFTFPSSIESPFDAVWDRGALGSISIRQRTKYVSVLTQLMEKNCRMLLEVIEKKPDVDHEETPFDFPDEELRHQFGYGFELKLVDSIKMEEYIDMPEKRQFTYKKISAFRIYLIQRNKDV